MNPNRVVRVAEERDLDTVVALRAEMFAAMGVPAEAGEWRRNARAWFADGRAMYERAGFKETGHPAMRADLRP